MPAMGVRRASAQARGKHRSGARAGDGSEADTGRHAVGRVDTLAEAVRVRLVRAAGAPFLFVACVFTYYGQLNRVQSGDTYGTIYTALEMVRKHTIWLDDYFHIIQQHAGEHPYMVTTGPGGHLVNVTPSAASVLAVPVVAVFSAFGVNPQDWGAWMEADMLTAALASAASVAVVFILLTRLTTRGRAFLIAATYAWGTLEWGISGQALWEHTGATLALGVALLAFVDGRLVLAGAALAAMVAFRPTTPVIALCLLPLVGRNPRAWGRLLLGVAPFAIPFLVYNTIAFGSPLHQGYGTAHLSAQLTPHWRFMVQGTLGLLLSPGRGLFVYSPVVLFAVYGAIRGFRQPLYRWCAVASAAYVVVAANSNQWWGGESFGPRRLTDVLPALVLLLVPAIDAIARTRWLWVYLASLTWSVFVELLGAAAWPPSLWFDGNPDYTRYSIWWHVTNNELASKLGSNGLPLRLGEMLAICLCALWFGYLMSITLRELRQGRAFLNRDAA
jgi:hypothetical protein